MRSDDYNKVIRAYKDTVLKIAIIIFVLGILNKLFLKNNIVDFLLYGTIVGYFIGSIVSFWFFKRKGLLKKD